MDQGKQDDYPRTGRRASDSAPAGQDWHGIDAGDVVSWAYPGKPEAGPAIVLRREAPWVPDANGLVCDLTVRMALGRSELRVPSSICRIERARGRHALGASIRSDKRPRG